MSALPKRSEPCLRRPCPNAGRYDGYCARHRLPPPIDVEEAPVLEVVSAPVRRPRLPHPDAGKPKYQLTVNQLVALAELDRNGPGAVENLDANLNALQRLQDRGLAVWDKNRRTRLWSTTKAGAVLLKQIRAELGT